MLEWLASLVLSVWLWLWRPLRSDFKKQAHVIKTHKLNEGAVYRAADVKDGPLLAHPFPGVTTLHEVFM